MAEKPWWKQAPAPSAPNEASASSASVVGDLADGQSLEVRGSGAEPYLLKNTGGTYSCTCPAWRHQGAAIDRRTCKHLRALRGDAAETARVGQPSERAAAASPGSESGKAPPLLLAHSWQNDADLTGWWMSEKLDGVRAYWDGSKFLSRLGNVYLAPDWFLEMLPKTPLDGELWGGRGNFQKTVSVVRRQDRGEGWRDVSFLVFDAPAEDAPFEERHALVVRTLAEAAARAPHLGAHGQVRCESLVHLREELARVEALGGEGLMMRKPGSRYEVGRSHTLLKVKSFKDTEAEVVAHVPGMGKHKGRLGALECVLPDGTRFSVGTGLSDAERNAPPPIGAVVTVRYQELSTDGVPRFPSYLGVRDDVRFERTPRAAASPSTSAPSPARPAPPATAEPSGEGEAAYRRFLRDGVSWEIALAGNAHVTRRFGTGGSVETTRAVFPDARAAWRDAERCVAEKREAGYVETED
jgi:DNA ligase-1